MSDMRSLDIGADNPSARRPIYSPPVSVRELAPLQHAGVRHRPDWPFLHYQEGGKFYLNKAPRKPRGHTDVGDALW